LAFETLPVRFDKQSSTSAASAQLEPRYSIRVCMYTSLLIQDLIQDDGRAAAPGAANFSQR
jgi:hypothetical protein